jgi:hypothetical protein
MGKMSHRSYPQVSLYAQKLNVRLTVALGLARRGDKQKATQIATEALSEYADKLLLYTWNSRVKLQLKKPKDLTLKEKEDFKNRMVNEKIADFQKIIADV